MPNPIPARESIYDIFQGYVALAPEGAFLTKALFDDMSLLAEGELIVRYGIRYLGKPHLAIVPELVALDYGHMLTGESAWEFLMNRSNLYPRADVIGHMNSGADEMITVKSLDIMLPVMVLIYDSLSNYQPLAAPLALISTDDASSPERLRHYLPVYPSLSAYRIAQTDDRA